MKTILLSCTALALVGATGPLEPRFDRSLSDNETVNATREAEPDRRDCRDRIHRAREALGQRPLFRRELASPDNPLAIHAVERRQDGCPVIVMMGDPDDIRPVPEPEQRRMPLMPADREQ